MARRGWVLLLILCACAPLRGPDATPSGLRLSELAGEGDAERRTSLDLVLQGLGEDASGRPAAALAEYQSALRVDPTNPWVYLALARHHVDGTQPERALPFLDQARALVEAQGSDSPRVEAHLLGLRGAALVASGRPVEGLPLLEEARALAPDVWADGHLSAHELQ